MQGRECGEAPPWRLCWKYAILAAELTGEGRRQSMISLELVAAQQACTVHGRMIADRLTGVEKYNANLRKIVDYLLTHSGLA